MGDEGLYENIFSSLIDGLIIVLPDLKILRGNLALEEMFRESRDSFEGKPVERFFPQQPAVLERMATVFGTGVSYGDLECLGFRKLSRTTFPVNITISPILDRENRVQSIILIVKDTSLLKELQETSRQMDRLANLGVLALGMAHEIKNPLLSIGGSAHLLSKELSSPDQKKYLEIVVSEVNRINRMVDRMLDFTRIRKLCLNKVNIHKILEEIILLEKESLGKKKGRFVQVYDPSLPPIDIDEDQIKQVFINLIQNAIDALPKEGGEIRVLTRITADHMLKLAPNLGTRSILVEIKDTGSGIAEENLNKLFTPFFTTKPKGNGLGLPLSLKIIEDHQGKIKVLSEKNVGTTMQVFIPIQQSPVTA
jgi:two-component system nitrogen regulation sensor histidine kinase GlnL